MIEQYTKFVKPAFDAYVAPSRKHADVVIPWARCADGTALTPDPDDARAAQWPHAHVTARGECLGWLTLEAALQGGRQRGGD